MSHLQIGGEYDIVSRTLARNRLNVSEVVSFVLGAVAPMTVIAGGATAGWAVTGVTGIPVAYLAIGVALAFFAVGYTTMSRTIVNAGAFYSYITQGLGRIPGVGAAFTALYSYNLMQIGLYGGFGAVASKQLLAWFGLHVAWWVCAFAALIIIGLLGVWRVDINGRILAVLLIAEIVITAVYSVVELRHPAGGTITFDTLAPARLFDNGIGAGLATAIAGFVGFEATAVYAEEARDPKRTVPRATYVALLVSGALYALCSWAMSVAAGSDKIVEQARTQGSDLMFSLVAPHLAHWWVNVGHLLFITSLFAALLAFHNTVARYAFALGRERVLPAWLGTTGQHNSAPKWGSLTQTMLAAAVLAGYAVSGLDPFVYLFFWLTVLGGVGVLILMTFTSIAVVAYFARPERRMGVNTWNWVVAPILATLMLAYALYLTVDQFAVLLGLPDPHSPWRWTLLASFGAVAGLGMLWAVVLKITSSDIYAKIGLGAASVTNAAPVKAPALHRQKDALND